MNNKNKSKLESYSIKKIIIVFVLYSYKVQITRGDKKMIEKYITNLLIYTFINTYLNFLNICSLYLFLFRISLFFIYKGHEYLNCIDYI